MGLGVTFDGVHETWDIPVKHVNDPEWKDNTWIVQHLRQLADKIEQENPEIYAVGMRTTVQYGPSFYIEVFPKR